MSQYPPALEFLLNNEDASRSYAVVADPTPDDRHAQALSGINSHYWPTEFSRIAALPQDLRAGSVAEFYFTHYWTPIKAGGLLFQDLANRYLDQAVNAGSMTACSLLQEAVNALRSDCLLVDGLIGPLTLEAVNKCDHDAIFASFRRQRVIWYTERGEPAALIARAAR